MAEVSSPTRENCDSVSLSTQKWVMTDCPPRQEKAASEWLCNEPLSLIQWRKPTKMKAVHKVRNKDLVRTSSCAWMALLGQFRQAEYITGSFDETAGYRSCRSSLELCSMWLLIATNFTQHARKLSGWRVARGVDQKCQNTENNVYRWQCII